MRVVLAVASILVLLGACSRDAEPGGQDDDAGNPPRADSGTQAGEDAGGDARVVDAGPTAQQLAQAAELAAVIAYLRANTAYPYPLDYAAIVATGQSAILYGNGTDATYQRALYGAVMAIPQGHQGFGVPGHCGMDVPFQTATRRGVCGRPHPRGIIVTLAEEGNPLGLQAGDLVTGLAGSESLHAALFARPMCGVSMPSEASAQGMVAATFGDLVETGETLTVESSNGRARDVVVGPMPDGPFLLCGDPFGRPVAKAAYAELRDDGVAVIRLPSFMDPEQTFPENPTEEQFMAYRAAFQAKIQAVFDSVKSASKLVWDLRGNGGGLTQVGLDIASGFPGAARNPVSYCTIRQPNSDPPTFTTQHVATYALEPGGPFAYPGKVAVLIDELDYSAADYFPLVVKERTDAILVGAKTSGAFGATSGDRAFAGPPATQVYFDGYRCVRADDDTPLETKSTEPHVPVAYDPVDLSAGRDTVLEAAVAALSVP